MNIKRYRAKNTKECIELMKKELGPDAIIFETKQIKNAKGEDEIEIIAARDKGVKPVNNEGRPQDVESPIQHELSEIKRKLNYLVNWTECRDIHNFSSLLNRLLSAGVGKESAIKVAKKIENKIGPGIEIDYDTLLKEELASLIPSAPIRIGTKPAVIALIGPTGTGKTTTIAKLASNFTIFDSLKTHLITIDTYRIAAVEQLKTFADILGIPIEVVITPDEFPDSIERHNSADVIFVDTAGRSPKDARHMKELVNFFRVLRPDEVHLVLSMTTKLNDMLDIIDRFLVVEPDKLIFTKLDETDTFGGILDAVTRVNKPVSYLTMGQNVPEDIERADSAKIAEYIIGGECIKK